MKKRYQHLLFDLDHTIWDFEKNSQHVIFELFKQFELKTLLNVDAEAFFEAFSLINEKLWLRYRQGFIRQDELRWKRFFQTLLAFKKPSEPLARDMSVCYLELLPIQSALMPHAIEMLDYCRDKGYEMHIITNGFEETQMRKMDNSKISHYFKEVITSERSMSLKPHKEIYEFTLKAIGATAEDCLMIGDNYEADIVGAQNMEIDQVYYDPYKNNDKSAATYSISDLKELTLIL